MIHRCDITSPVGAIALDSREAKTICLPIQKYGCLHKSFTAAGIIATELPAITNYGDSALN